MHIYKSNTSPHSKFEQTSTTDSQQLVSLSASQTVPVFPCSAVLCSALIVLSRSHPPVGPHFATSSRACTHLQYKYI